MQVDSISNEDIQSSRTMKRAMGVLAAFAVAAAAGLASVDVPEADLKPHVLKTDANELRGGTGSATPASAPAAPGGGELDPAMLRPDGANDHHG
jgi:hypothetical protein